MADQPAPRYSFSFTAASLRPDLARVLAAAYVAAGDWPGARARVRTANALQLRSARSQATVEGELRQRLQRLTPTQLAVLADAGATDAAALAWLAMLKRNRFAFEFAAELLRDTLASGDPDLRRSDYEEWVEAHTPGHPELARLTDRSRAKVRQVLLHMAAEAGLLRPGRRASPTLGTVQRPVLSAAVTEAVVADDAPRWLAGFLVPDRDLSRP